MTRGIIYVVTGDSEYQKMCLASIQTVRKHGYNGDILVITDNAIGFDWQSFRQSRVAAESVMTDLSRFDPSQRSRWIKTRLFDYAPFDQNLFLDCDVFAVSNFDFIWNYVGNDFCIAFDKNKISEAVQASPEERRFTIPICNDGKQFNSGVMLFQRTCAVSNLFTIWHQEWKRFQGADQLALLRALKYPNDDLRLHCLPLTLNVQGKASKVAADSVLWHPCGSEAKHNLLRNVERLCLQSKA